MILFDPLAATVADELARCGVTDVVISPGLHSGVLAHALYEHPDIRLHVRIDERSAAFLALGMARRSGRPVAVCCTSGTAAANLHPAVLEGHHARLPLVVLTTDRTSDLRGTGANQTTDQARLFGSAARHFAELEYAPASARRAVYWRSVVSRTVGASGTGPVHLNLLLREPMVVTEDTGERDRPLIASTRPAGRPWTRVERPVGRPVALDVPARGVVVVGDAAADPAAAVAFAERVGWPLLAEPQTGARYGSAAVTTYGYLLSHPGFRERARPDLVVAFGRQGIHLALTDYLGHAPDVVVVDPGADWPDPTRGASLVVPAIGEVRQPDTDPGWAQLWRDADKAARTALDAALDDNPLSEPRIARDLVDAMPAGSVLFAGSSMPIRDVERTMRPHDDVRVLANRGLSGIDGAVSSALGAALAHDGRAYALLGDLSLLHDQNGLITGPHSPRPDLVVVVVNNNGGGIFSMVPHQGDTAFETYFGTPHDVRVEHVAAATGWPYERVDTAAALRDALDRPGPRLVEVVTDREANAAFHRTIAGAVAAAVDTVL